MVTLHSPSEYCPDSNSLWLGIVIEYSNTSRIKISNYVLYLLNTGKCLLYLCSIMGFFQYSRVEYIFETFVDLQSLFLVGGSKH